MIAYTSCSLSWHNCLKIRGAGLLVALVLLTLVGLQPAAAEESKEEIVITTLIAKKIFSPEEGERLFRSGAEHLVLLFRTDSIPAEATVTKATLRLVCQCMQDGDDKQLRVEVLAAGLTDPANPEPEELFAQRRLSLNNPKKDGAMEWVREDVPKALKVKESGMTSFALVLKPGAARKWYSIGAEESKHHPRVILEYTVDNRQAPFQSEGLPSTLSPRAFLPKKNPSAQNSHSIQTVASKVLSKTPAFFNNLIYLVTDDGMLQALSPLGGLIWSDPVTNPGQHITVSKSGRLYIVGEGHIITYQLDPHNPKQDPVQILNPRSAKEHYKPTVPPTVGPDGSLYFVNLQQVYGLNLDFQELWKVPLLESTTTSHVTVGPSGQFVYLIDNKEGLVTINAQTGETFFENPLPNQDELERAENPALHAPVVIKHPNGEKIYVAANSANSGVLTCFNNSGSEVTPCENWETPPGLYSQPSLGKTNPNQEESNTLLPKKLYSVRVEEGQGTLMKIDWLTGKETKREVPFVPIEVGFNKPFLLRGGNLALDQEDNIFLWDGDGEKTKLHAFNFKNVLEPVFDASTSSDFAEETQLLFGTDGTLYANDGTVLRAILPKYTLGPDQDMNIFSPTHLRVDGTAEAQDTPMLSAGGSVLLGTGFKIKKGATLKVRTNVLDQPNLPE